MLTICTSVQKAASSLKTQEDTEDKQEVGPVPSTHLRYVPKPNYLIHPPHPHLQIQASNQNP
jgi:hypothetical protein